MPNRPSPTPLRRAFAIALSSLGIILVVSPLHAANKAWSTNTPGPANGNFSGTNWTVGTTGVATPTSAAATGDALFFDTSAISTLSNDLSCATFAGITFNSGASAYTVGGNAFTLSAAFTNNSSSLQAFSNTITLAAAQSITGAGNISLSGNLTGAGTNLTKSGTGTLSLSGTTNAITGNMVLSAGRLNVTAGTTNFAGAFSNLASTASTTAIASTSSGATLGWTGANGGNFANAASASAILYNAGTFNITGTTTNSAGTYLGNAANSYGYLQNSSTGTTTIGGRLWIAQAGAAAGATGVLDITGGTVTVNGTNQTAPIQINGDGNTHTTSTSYAGVNVVNGTLAIAKSAAQTNINTGQNEYTSINITGTGKFTAGTSGTDAGIGLGVTSIATNTATLTVANGGTLETSYIYNTNALGTGAITFDNGTIRSLFNNTTGIIQGTNTKTYIQSGGVTFDTNGFATTVQNALLAPTGNGLSTITLGGTATGYVGAPVVVISGGGGTGAAAIANFDPSTGTVTGITITSKGSGYTSAPTITLVGGNGGSTGAGVGTATATSTIAAVTGGGLTKTGTGTLTLSAANTFTGPTKVTAGTLALGNVNALQKSTLDLTGAGAFTFTVAGTNTYNIGGLKGAGALTIGANSLAMGATAASSLSIADATVYQSSPAISVTGTGTVTFNSTLTVSVDSLLSTGLHTFDLFGGTATLAGGFTTVSIAGSYVATLNSGNSYAFTDLAGNSYSFSNSTGDLAITVAAIPEPATYAALCGALFLGIAAIRRRRKTAA